MALRLQSLTAPPLSKPMSAHCSQPTMESKSLTLSYCLAGNWVENEFKTDDPQWRETLKVAVESGSAVKISYE